ncbi:MAG: hypothetical protein PVH11_11080 [Anaerolineae bacterium]|jgi:hypothetical protein
MVKTEGSKDFVIGIYDSLAQAERAEMHLEEAQLPVGQMSMLAVDTEAEKDKGNITAHEVAETLTASGIQLGQKQIARYEQALDGGKLLLIFRGNAEQVAKADHVLGNTDADGLAILYSARTGDSRLQNQENAN